MIIIYNLGKSVTIRWVPGYKGAPGNERVDEFWKEDNRDIDTHPRSGLRKEIEAQLPD
jgi:ribonuclease HI